MTAPVKCDCGRLICVCPTTAPAEERARELPLLLGTRGVQASYDVEEGPSTGWLAGHAAALASVEAMLRGEADRYRIMANKSKGMLRVARLKTAMDYDALADRVKDGKI